MSRLLHRLVAPVVAVAILSGAAQAQEATNPTRAKECRSDARVVSTRRPDSLFREAVLSMAYCDVTGPPVLIARWNAASTDTATISLIEWTSARLRDARLLTALVSMVQRRSATVDRRLAAMWVLVSYFDPRRGVSGDDLLAPDSTKGLFSTFDFGTIDGSQPFPSSYRTTIATAMQAVAANDVNEQVRNAAAFLRRELYWISPASTPLLPGGFVLKYVCGNRFEMRNYDNVPMILRYRVDETADSGTIDIGPRPSAEGQSYRSLEFTTRVKGTVSIRHLSTLLQTTANGGTSCDRGPADAYTRFGATMEAS